MAAGISTLIITITLTGITLAIARTTLVIGRTQAEVTTAFSTILSTAVTLLIPTERLPISSAATGRIIDSRRQIARQTAPPIGRPIVPPPTARQRTGLPIDRPPTGRQIVPRQTGHPIARLRTVPAARVLLAPAPGSRLRARAARTARPAGACHPGWIGAA